MTKSNGSITQLKKKDIIFSAWYWQSSHNVENEEMANLTVENKERKRQHLATLKKKKLKQLGEAQSACKCAHHCSKFPSELFINVFVTIKVA